MRKILQDFINGKTIVTKKESTKDRKTTVHTECITTKTGGPFERLLQKFEDKVDKVIKESFKAYHEKVSHAFADINADVARSKVGKATKDTPASVKARKLLAQKLEQVEEDIEELEVTMGKLERGLESVQNFMPEPEPEALDESSEGDEDGESLFVSTNVKRGMKRTARYLT
jgi:hypothetical protein